jgi:hypothetical protein
MNVLLHPGITAQFYTLIGEAQYTLNRQLPEELEHYLVSLLIRFIDKHEIIVSSVGQEHLEAQLSLHQNPHLLKDLGDSCLLISGLFPERKSHRGLNKEYYIEIGQRAFYSYALTGSLSSASLFSHISSDFPLLSTVLAATRHPQSPFPPSFFPRPC